MKKKIEKLSNIILVTFSPFFFFAESSEDQQKTHDAGEL